MPDRKQSVAGIAIDQAGRIFIARRKAGGDLGGKWEFPGGKVKAGESGEAALRREYLEELGVSIETGSQLAAALFTHNGIQFELQAYRVFLGSGPFTLAEHTRWRWATLGEIEKLDFAGSDRLLLPELQAYLEEQFRVHDR
ncbi:MAG: (deoxy)nucleoside triphosphate pyrophosphohydrolase [Treponema sp.]|jgi:8-oxo-dGTP diphosphatase|nr:(deoxy)nucleoside triphosphate pyrophosphohydrolase [Treponema sp.]